MSIYIYNLMSISILAVLLELSKEKLSCVTRKRVFIIVSCFQLIMIQGLRATYVGTDVNGYINVYNIMRYSNFSDVFNQRMEFGFVSLVKLLTLFNISIQAYLFVLSLFIILPLGYTIYKYSERPFLSFFIYITFGFYSASFCTIRQNIAYGIILLTLGSIKQRKLWKFIIIVLIAWTIHKSALIFLPAYLIVKMKINKTSIILIICAFVVIFMFRYQIADYAINNYFTYYEIVVSNSHSWMLIGIVLLVIGLLRYKYVTLNSDNHIYYVLIAIALSIMIMATVTTNAMRVADYYYIFLILYVPAVFGNIRDKRLLTIVLYILIVCSTIIYILLLSRDSGYGIVPYKFFWE